MRSREELDKGIFDCPMQKGPVPPVRCMFCGYGHMLDCHYPLSCEEARCSHYQAEMEDEGEPDYGDKYDLYYALDVPDVKAVKEAKK